MNSHLLKSAGRRCKASTGVTWVLAASLLSAISLIWPIQCPAPLVYKAGEGWVYEEPKNGTNSWMRSRAIDQLRVASEAYDKKDFDLAFKAAQRTVDVWALSDYAPEAEYLLGKLYLKGQGVGKDVQQANLWLGDADRRGHLAAQLTRYAAEEGILDAPEQSFKALLLKAKGGDIEAQFITAVLYALGEGTPQNPKEAKLWFVKAAQQDRRHAAYCLAMLLLKQDAGAAADTAEAVSWLRKAADRGDASAQFALGDLYCKGEKVPVNAVEAYVQFSLAQEQGQVSSARRLQEVKKRMSEPQIAEADKRLAEIKARVAAGQLDQGTRPSITAQPSSPSQ